ncbi:MAG: hypothetical protein ACOY5R_06550 [Pseudomonadota bacterium]
MGVVGLYAQETEQAIATRPPAEAPIRDTGFLDNIAAGFQASRSGPDAFSNQARYENNARDEIADALEKRGIAVRRIGVAEAIGYQRRLDRGEKLPAQAMDHLAKFNAMLSALADEQRRDPSFLTDYAGVRDIPSLEAHVIKLRRRDMAAADEVQRGATGWGAAGGFIGGIGGELTKPETYIPLGPATSAVGGIARQILSVAAREGAANAAMTAALDPLVQADAARLGIDRTLKDTASDIALSAAAGAVLGGAAKAATMAPDAIAGARERFLSTQFARLPESVQRRMTEAATIDDRALAAVIEERFPGDALTLDERAALSVLKAEVDVRESNPFKHGPEADMLHSQRLAAAVDALKTGAPPPIFAPAKRPPLKSQTALSWTTGDVATRIAMAESGGKANAKNDRSSATGVGQFIDQTWLGVIKQHGTKERLGRYARAISNVNGRWVVEDKSLEKQILDMRLNGQLSMRMLQYVTEDYRAILAKAKLPFTPTNAYLIHFLGPETGRKMASYAPDLNAWKLLPPEVVDANASVLRGKTAGEVRAWAAQRMKEENWQEALAGTRWDGGTSVFGPDMPEGVELRPDLVEDPAIRREAERELYGPEPGRPAELIRAIDALRTQDMPVDAPDLATATDMAGIDVKPRKPRKLPDGPAELLTQIARWGGLRDSEGNDFAVTAGLSNRMTQGGRVLRKGGMSVDQLGEKLWEAGWFGPPSVAERPSLDEVIDLVERGARERVYHPEDVAIVTEKQRMIDDGEEEIRFLLDNEARTMGFENVDGGVIEDAIDRIRRGEDADQALIGAINARTGEEMAAIADQAGVGGAPVDGGMTPDDWSRLGEMQDSLARWEDPEGQAALDQAMSIEHDLMKALGIDEAGVYRIGDGNDEWGLAALLDEADGEDAAIARMEGCMVPPGGPTE